MTFLGLLLKMEYFCIKSLPHLQYYFYKTNLYKSKYLYYSICKNYKHLPKHFTQFMTVILNMAKKGPEKHRNMTYAPPLARAFFGVAQTKNVIITIVFSKQQKFKVQSTFLKLKITPTGQAVRQLFFVYIVISRNKSLFCVQMVKTMKNDAFFDEIFTVFLRPA